MSEDDKPPIPTIGLGGVPAPRTEDFIRDRGCWQDAAVTAAEKAAERLKKLRDANQYVLCPEPEHFSPEELEAMGYL